MTHLDHEHNVSTRTMSEVIYSFNKSLSINQEEISWPGGKKTKLSGGVKRKEPPAPENSCAEKKIRVDNEINNYKKILKMMQPEETVARTLRRLEGGKAGMSDSQRLKMKKKNVTQASADPIRMNEMIMVVNEIKSTEIYEETFQSIIVKINQLQAVAGDDAVRDEEHQEAEEAAKQSEAQDEEDGKTGRRLQLTYHNSPIEEIFSLESSSGSDWSPPTKNISDDGENDIHDLRPNINVPFLGMTRDIRRQAQPTVGPDQVQGHSHHQELDQNQNPASQPD